MGVRLALVLGAVALMLGARPVAAQETTDDQPIAAQTGLIGRVVAAARCPVPLGDDDGTCASQPFATVLTIRSGDGAVEVAQVATDASGAFSMDLDPGSYVVEVPVFAASILRVEVTVGEQGPTPLLVRVPIGLRGPPP